METILPEIRNRTGFSVSSLGLELFDLGRSRAVLFYWGAAEGKKLRQARIVTQGLPEAFFLAPPPKTPEDERELGDALLLRQQGDRFCVDDLRPFLRRLGWTG